VLLPPPLGPTSATVSPGRSSRSTRSRTSAARVGYAKETPSRRTDAWSGLGATARPDRATTSNIRLLDPTIISPAFTQFQQGKNFYNFPDQLSIDRYNGPDGNLRDYVVAARELNPDRLIVLPRLCSARPIEPP